MMAHYERGKQELSGMWSAIDATKIAARVSDSIKDMAGTPENANMVEAIERSRAGGDAVQLEAGIFDDTTADTVALDLEEEAVAEPSKMQAATDYMKGKGWGQSVINGILGNMEVESAGTFDHTQQEAGGGGGHGLFQLDYMKNDYNGYLKDVGVEDSMESQIDFIGEIIKNNTYHDIGAGNRKKLNPLTFKGSSSEYADLFARNLERPKSKKHGGNPKWKERMEFAAELDH